MADSNNSGPSGFVSVILVIVAVCIGIWAASFLYDFLVNHIYLYWAWGPVLLSTLVCFFAARDLIVRRIHRRIGIGDWVNSETEIKNVINRIPVLILTVTVLTIASAVWVYLIPDSAITHFFPRQINWNWTVFNRRVLSYGWVSNLHAQPDFSARRDIHLHIIPLTVGVGVAFSNLLRRRFVRSVSRVQRKALETLSPDEVDFLKYRYERVKAQPLRFFWRDRITDKAFAAYKAAKAAKDRAAEAERAKREAEARQRQQEREEWEKRNRSYNRPSNGWEDPKKIKYLSVFNLRVPFTVAELKKARNRIISEIHPDKLGPDAPPERRALAEEHTKTVNEAYEFLAKTVTS